MKFTQFYWHKPKVAADIIYFLMCTSQIGIKNNINKRNANMADNMLFCLIHKSLHISELTWWRAVSCVNGYIINSYDALYVKGGFKCRLYTG
jgi:hypothetical protein